MTKMFAARAYINFLVFSLHQNNRIFFWPGHSFREIFFLVGSPFSFIFFDFDSLSSVVGVGAGKENTEERNEFFTLEDLKK